MKKQLLRSVPILLILATINVTAQESIRITNGEWLPYHSKNLPHYGAGSRIATEAFALEKVNVEWGFFPWSRAYLSIGNGKWDASIGWIKTPAREKEFLFSKPLYRGEWVFFHLKSYSFDWNTVEDLAGIRIGATANYNYGKKFDEAEKKKLFSVRRVSKEEQNIRMLLGGRIQVFISEKNGGYAKLKAYFTPEEYQQITHHPKPIRTGNHYLIFSKNKKNKRMVTLFNKGLERLRETGKVEEYLNSALPTEAN